MATDFFDRQDYARRQTTWLLVMFGLAVVAIVLIIYFVVVIGLAGANDHRGKVSPPLDLWQPLVFCWVTLGTLTVIGLGSLYKIAELSGGGQQVALTLGGRVVDQQTADLDERRLLNVVEEMALASGVSVPPVYVLDEEQGINAFAAGHQPDDAVVAVSAGCLKYLTREELQGVIGHEFSHILNGDMRLNLRLIGITYGILVLAILGYYIVRMTGSIARGSRKNSAGAAAGIFMFGLALLILGYVGVFFGRLIKSAISRRREFLADASAVQFTRNPDGIAGALKKIGGLSLGSRILNGHAEEVSHMFFGDAFAGAIFNLFATHPPLPARITALDPSFDGVFPEVRPLVSMPEVAGLRGDGGGFRNKALYPQKTRGAKTSSVSFAPTVAALDAGDMVRQIGRPRSENLQQAVGTIDRMPATLLAAAREPYVAQAVIYALLLSRDDEPAKVEQLRLLREKIELPLFQETQRLSALAEALPAESRLPLVELAVPSIKRASPQQYVQFRQTVDDLVNADGRTDLFEYCLRTVLFSSLDVYFGLQKSPTIRYLAVIAVAQPATIVLSTLAYIGQNEPEAVHRAFQAGAKGLLSSAAIAPRQQCTLRDFDDALGKLAQASPGVKRALIGGVATCLACDGNVTVEESELLRTVAAVLACPMPMVAPT